MKLCRVGRPRRWTYHRQDPWFTCLNMSWKEAMSSPVVFWLGLMALWIALKRGVSQPRTQVELSLASPKGSTCCKMPVCVLLTESMNCDTAFERDADQGKLGWMLRSLNLYVKYLDWTSRTRAASLVA